ncbi:response regulator [Desulforegula conservatrix]|uniref:response regulator n=1 Tax=Desulforegula conservatrix TaxID=153026 RepID=UPI00040938E5|nr:response regulator [Desulforegula conservatrix]
MNILIVDDRDENLYLLEVLFKGNGYDVQSVPNGAEALERLESGGVDLIISDILMPVMDGFELCRRVRANEKLCHIPFIFYTATYTGPQDELFALKIGADRFIQKPCEPDVIMGAVRDVMTIARSKEIVLATESAHEEEILKLYNQRLVRKLEQKMLELEKEVQDRQKAEEILKQSETRYRFLFNSIRDAIVVVDTKRAVIDCNPAFVDLFGYSLEDIIGKETFMFFANDEALRQVENEFKKYIADYRFLYKVDFKKKNGAVFPGEVNIFYLMAEKGILKGFIGIIRDITERIHAEKTEKDLESRLHQSQKMEAIGRLAGGVAHDFNNMLSIIIGYADMALTRLNPLDPLYNDVLQIINAGERSADLTRQLLAFSRKQPILPVATSLNSLIENRLKMLGRLIGEDINVKFFPGAGLWNIKIDTSQMDQILVNLTVNARDAISSGGIITIETANVDHVAEDSIIAQGEYVMISVADTGKGMDAETIEHIFEPFFTTKENLGTGLGLATVYGIVKQNEGFVNVYSEPGIGTTFKIYIPRFYGEATEKIEKEQTSNLNGKETILVVEDEEIVLAMAKKILSVYGYKVFEAKTPGDACLIAETHKGEINLFLSDMVMPGMTGVDLQKKIHKIIPDLKTIFMSGYTPQFIAQKGFIEENFNFIQKPFSVVALAQKVREVLDR